MTELFTHLEIGLSLSSGGRSDWLIDCAALSDNSLVVLARIGNRLLGPFDWIFGVPKGGVLFSHAMYMHRARTNPEMGFHRLLIVDDVMTTGRSMEEQAAAMLEAFPGDKLVIQGLVIFSRLPPGEPGPEWVRSIFRCEVPG